MSWLNLLGMLLKAETSIRHVHDRPFKSVYKEHEEVVATARLILLKEGAMRYCWEDSRFLIEAPAVLFVPPWVRRYWQVPRGKTCVIAWCEFSPSFFEPALHQVLINRNADWKLETASLRRMARDWQGDRGTPQTPETALRLQGELKACLARFFAGGGDLIRGGKEPSPLNAQWSSEITRAQLWLEQNFTLPDAIRQLQEHAAHGNSTFRRAFRLQTGYTPTSYTLALRMRYARFLLAESGRLVKEVADAVGYRDPLYFSRQYHAFWGHPPRSERV